MLRAAEVCQLPAIWTDLPAAALATSRAVPDRPSEVVLVNILHADDEHRESSRSSHQRAPIPPTTTPTPTQAGAASYAYVHHAITLANLPLDHPWHAHAVVTAPISKHHWALAGHTQFPGHTELFAHATNTAKFAMMFHAPPIDDTPNDKHPAPTSHVGLNLILATVHQPLRTVAQSLTTQRILDAIHLGHAQLQRMGITNPRIGVCGLNPHAGEQGLLGDEDDRIIAPAVSQARAQGILATGPHPADTIFQTALSRLSQGHLTPPTRHDLVVAMYHDQGLAPLKTLAWDRAVNLTVGLPFPRTSPDHGTATDIAGQGIAHEGSMKAAMHLATTLALH
jgi:4-hydroxythreonine-4-phosphate dehydrogenase